MASLSSLARLMIILLVGVQCMGKRKRVRAAASTPDVQSATTTPGVAPDLAHTPGTEQVANSTDADAVSAALAMDMDGERRYTDRREIHRLSTVTVGNQRVTSLLGNVVNYRFSLPELQLRKGAVYTGANSRLRRVVRDLLTGRRQVKVGIVGGSISWGQGASKRGVTDWFSLVSRYLIQAFPNTNVTTRNGCVPGTPSE